MSQPMTADSLEQLACPVCKRMMELAIPDNSGESNLDVFACAGDCGFHERRMYVEQFNTAAAQVAALRAEVERLKGEADATRAELAWVRGTLWRYFDTPHKRRWHIRSVVAEYFKNKPFLALETSRANNEITGGDSVTLYNEHMGHGE